MIISRTPLRISFAGGGSDLPAYYEFEPGAVLSTSINKYIYITVNRKFDSKIRASYSVTEIVDAVSDLKHELIREALRLVGVEGGVEITSISDVPSEGTGLGSSSSYTVGLLNALYAYKAKHVDAARLGREACQIEIDICGKVIGKQDQYIAAYGGLQFIQFDSDGTVFVDPVICRRDTRERLQESLMLMYTGITRSADDILSVQAHNTMADGDRRQSLVKMVSLAKELHQSLTNNDLHSFGELLHQAWLEKRTLADGISSPQIDDWYETARSHGAIGGKILGAGGGGFLMLFAPKEKHTAIARALPLLQEMKVRFEPQGSKIIFVEGA
jgi:D-glycero-alpha-D-manno-heptose-7-phosphate kinase